jgi:hypothetical protein
MTVHNSAAGSNLYGFNTNGVSQESRIKIQPQLYDILEYDLLYLHTATGQIVKTI